VSLSAPLLARQAGVLARRHGRPPGRPPASRRWTRTARPRARSRVNAREGLRALVTPRGAPCIRGSLAQACGEGDTPSKPAWSPGRRREEAWGRARLQGSRLTHYACVSELFVLAYYVIIRPHTVVPPRHPQRHRKRAHLREPCPYLAQASPLQTPEQRSAPLFGGGRGGSSIKPNPTRRPQSRRV
jgi:hypothetical protein